MGARLAVGVVVRGPDGGPRYLAPGDELPTWAKKQVHASRLEAAIADPPPKTGRGSSHDAWAIYAEQQGVQVELDAKREDIIAACEAAGVPTE